MKRRYDSLIDCSQEEDSTRSVEQLAPTFEPLLSDSSIPSQGDVSERQHKKKQSKSYHMQQLPEEADLFDPNPTPTPDFAEVTAVLKKTKTHRMIYSSFPNPSNYIEIEELLAIQNSTSNNNNNNNNSSTSSISNHNTPTKSWAFVADKNSNCNDENEVVYMDRSSSSLYFDDEGNSSSFGTQTDSQSDEEYQPMLKSYLTQPILEFDEQKIFDEMSHSHKDMESADSNSGCAKLIKEKEISSAKSLNSGNFAFTFKAVWKGQDVVLKVSKDKAGRNELEEIRLLNNLSSHPNVISILAVCTDFRCDFFDKSSLAIITPFQKGGDLQTFLKKQKRKLKSKDLQNLALGMSRGLWRLHKDHIVHRDVCTRNFLLNESGRVLICDFGLSRSVEPSNGDPSLKQTYEELNYYKAEEGSQIAWRWCPPEMLCTRKSDTKSDIWMLGVAFWELVTQANQSPFASISSSHELYAALMYKNVRPETPQNCPSVLQKLINECCNVKVQERPNIDYVVEVLMDDIDNGGQ